MKKLLFTALIAVSLVSSSFAAGTKNISNQIESSFLYDFGKVENVEWATKEKFSVATFTLNNEKTQAFYDNNGTLIGTSRSISTNELPAYAKRQIARKYASYTIKEAIEFDKTEHSAYFVSAEKDGKSVVLMIADGYVSIYK